MSRYIKSIHKLYKLYYIGSPKTPKNMLKSNEYGKKCFEYLI